MIGEPADVESRLMARARSAYELGRFRGALLQAVLLAVLTAMLGSWLVDARAWAWAPFTLVLWCAIHWLGGALLTGARYGLLAGGLTSLLPLSLLRPCCRLGGADMAATCTMPEMCVIAGALIAMPITSLAMRRCDARRHEAVLGVGLGVLALVAVKCSALFAGEALGLLGGMALGIVATAAIDHAPRWRAQ